MSFYLLGINHNTAPVDLREQLAFDPDKVPERLEELAAIAGVAEAAILSTCNRTELYCVLQQDDLSLRDWLLQHSQLGSRLGDCLYELRDDAAIAHCCSVAAGLDSAVLGEPQILGQMKDAYRLAQSQATTGPAMHRLFQHTFSVAKRVRSETAIGASNVSAASAAVDLARQLYSGFEKHTAMFIGAGEMIELTLRHLSANGLGRAIIANRSLGRGQKLASEFDAMVIPLTKLASHLHEADILIACTASPTVIVKYDDVRNALRKRRRKPMLLIDLAVPRDIDPQIGELNDAYLYGVDDLRSVISRNQSAREAAAIEAREMIASATEAFTRRQQALDAVPLITTVRTRLTDIRNQSLAQAQRQLAAGKPVDEVLDRLATGLTNRLMHEPTLRMREAGEQGDRELLAVASRLFGVGKDS